jgi:hypothetical protein
MRSLISLTPILSPLPRLLTLTPEAELPPGAAPELAPRQPLR